MLASGRMDQHSCWQPDQGFGFFSPEHLVVGKFGLLQATPGTAILLSCAGCRRTKVEQHRSPRKLQATLFM